MVKGMSIALGAVFLAGSAMAGPPGDTAAHGRAATVATFDMNRITCAEALSGRDGSVGYALVMLLGYAAGTGGISVQTDADIEAQLGAAYKFCEANPKARALAGFDLDLFNDRRALRSDR